jgi:hypothetical protein
MNSIVHITGVHAIKVPCNNAGPAIPPPAFAPALPPKQPRAFSYPEDPSQHIGNNIVSSLQSELEHADLPELGDYLAEIV